MPERVEYEPRLLHPDRRPVLPMDELRGAEFFDGNILSGGIVSGGGLQLKIVSSPVRIRPVNLSLFNNELGWLEVQFRDGGAHGGRVFGPVRILPLTERRFGHEELRGRFFTSSIYCEVRSGWTGQPLSTGVNVNIGVIQEPTDWYGD